MPRTSTLRRAFAAAAAGAAMALSAAPASAVVLPTQLPCVPGVTCPEEEPKCANRNVEPASGNLAVVRRATLCLLNVERAERDLSRFRHNRPLRGVANKYARSMVKLSFFDHVSPLGSTFVERIKRSAYLDDAKTYRLGENLAWGVGPLSTPRRIVRAWMLSPGHRANILNGGFRDIGVGVALGIPIAGGGLGATYVNEFGSRG
jgi:uncharacterized protein YkwD